MRYADIITLVSMFATHVERADYWVATRCGVHNRLFKRLKSGLNCRVDTLEAASQGLSDNWPDDLEWPPGIPRPPRSKREAA
jgi:hypothetical protein